MIKDIPLSPVKNLIKTIHQTGVKDTIFKKVETNINVLLQRTENRLKNSKNDALEKINVLHALYKDNMLKYYNELICKKKIIEPRTFGMIIDQFTKLMYKIEQIEDVKPETIIDMLNNSGVMLEEKQFGNSDINDVINQLIYNLAQDINTYKKAKNPYAELTELIAKSYFLTIIDMHSKGNISSDNEYLEKLRNSKTDIKTIFTKYPDIAWLINTLGFISYMYLMSIDEAFSCDDMISCTYNLTYDTPKEKDCKLSGFIVGETDFQSQNTILDLKVSKTDFTIDHIMQVGLYYMISNKKESIQTLRLYNPLLNKSLILSPNDIFKINNIGDIIEITAAKYIESTLWMRRKSNG